MSATATLVNRLVQSAFVSRMRTGTQFLFKKHLLLTNLGISAGLSATGDSIQQHYEKIKDPERAYNYRRTFNMSTAGVTIGTVCHFWYNWLDKFLPGRTFSIALKKMLLDQIICSPITIGTFFVTLAVVEKSSADEFRDELRSKPREADWGCGALFRMGDSTSFPTLGKCDKTATKIQPRSTMLSPQKLYTLGNVSHHKECYQSRRTGTLFLLLLHTSFNGGLPDPHPQMINFFFLPLRYRVLYDNTISLGYDVYTSYVKHEIPTETTSPDMPSNIAVRSISLISPSLSSSSSLEDLTPIVSLEEEAL
ncbi:hypothetical protein Fcan01_05962 [Folsomia candida]|uniref:Mpv17-like protein 2 n=1 Tax=Folsomia candida TaxID=158441 RepID=A0A226ESV4_FOLCA|nr:hypothetical protein Fcan01_05962 [Folsomia candida]